MGIFYLTVKIGGATSDAVWNLYETSLNTPYHCSTSHISLDLMCVFKTRLTLKHTNTSAVFNIFTVLKWADTLKQNVLWYPLITARILYGTNLKCFTHKTIRNKEPYKQAERCSVHFWGVCVWLNANDFLLGRPSVHHHCKHWWSTVSIMIAMYIVRGLKTYLAPRTHSTIFTSETNRSVGSKSRVEKRTVLDQYTAFVQKRKQTTTAL